jgi:hypothetical protein
MTTVLRTVLVLGGLSALGAAAACNRDTTPTSATPAAALGGIRAAVTLRLASVLSSPTALALGPMAGDGEGSGNGDGHGKGEFGRISLSQIDSLVVTVAKIEVRVPLPDSETAADSAAETTRSDSAEHGRDDDDHEQDEVGWDSLGIVGSGHLNLLKLPDSASAGLAVATGTLPPDTYRHVRLFVTGPMIFFNAPIITPTGDTLKPNIGYPVIIPSADSTGAAIKTDESFTVPTGGGNVQLFFDPDDTIRHVRITGDGKIIIPPVIR